MIPLLVLGGFSGFQAGLIAPLFFGVAHLHHIYQFIVHEGVPIPQAVASAAFQFVYTTLFGWYSAFLFVCTGSVLAPTFAHCFCNAMGFPDFGGVGASPHCGRTFPKSQYLQVTYSYSLSFPLSPFLVLSVTYVVGLSSFLVLLQFPHLLF
jgi:membrane protease YdiL (CAAX protease family)